MERCFYHFLPIYFAFYLLDQFLPLAEDRGDHSFVEDYRERAGRLRTSLEQNAWDGEWYRRAYFDDGVPLGSRQNDECQIDSLTQTWAVMAQADESRTDQALEAVFSRLVSEKDRLVTLFAPPFDKTSLDPGYIKGYLPGVRENGGQYTHAVLWLVQALTLKEDGDRAMTIFDYVNPILHTTTDDEVRKYCVEPYVVAADVYSVPPHHGRGGWTWYTGSASWTYRMAIEAILGLSMQGSVVSFHPCIPSEWQHFRLSLQKGKSTWEFSFKKGSRSESRTAEEDDTEASDTEFEIVDDGQNHSVEIALGLALTPNRKRSPQMT